MIFFSFTGIINNDYLNRVNFSNSTGESLTCDIWTDCFGNLKKMIIASNVKRKVIVIDEFSMIGKSNPDFVEEFGYFWNDFCSKRDDIVFIVSGSASSWMIKNVLMNIGGLYNRATSIIRLTPFKLKQTEEFLEEKGIKYSKTDIALAYMIFGGIPYYLDCFDQSLTLHENIDFLIFSENAVLKEDNKVLFYTLFDNSQFYPEVVEILSSKASGLSYDEILNGIPFSDDVLLQIILDDLVSDGMCTKIESNLDHKNSEPCYHLVDNYLCFYYNVVHKNTGLNSSFKNTLQNNPSFYSWREIAFEQLCFQHIFQIKIALGISAVITSDYYFKYKNTQIDLVFDRDDGIVNLCEIIFGNESYEMSKEAYDNIKNKKKEFILRTKSTKTIVMTLISFNSISVNKYTEIFDKVINVEDLFVDYK